MEKSIKASNIEQLTMEGYIQMQNQKYFKAYQYFTYCQHLLNNHLFKSIKDLQNINIQQNEQSTSTLISKQQQINIKNIKRQKTLFTDKDIQKSIQKQRSKSQSSDSQIITDSSFDESKTSSLKSQSIKDQIHQNYNNIKEQLSKNEKQDNSNSTVQPNTENNIDRYNKRIQELCLINRGVCMFKIGKLKEANEIWMTTGKHEIENTKHQLTISDFIEYNNNCELPLTILFNLSLSNLILSIQVVQDNSEQYKKSPTKLNKENSHHKLQKLIDTSLEFCQELILKIFNLSQNIQMKRYDCIDNMKEIKIIGTDNLKQKCVKLIDNIEKQMKNSQQKQTSNNDELNEEISFNAILINDMKQWLNQAIINIKIYIHHQQYHTDQSIIQNNNDNIQIINHNLRNETKKEIMNYKQSEIYRKLQQKKIRLKSDNFYKINQFVASPSNAYFYGMYDEQFMQSNSRQQQSILLPFKGIRSYSTNASHNNQNIIPKQNQSFQFSNNLSQDHFYQQNTNEGINFLEKNQQDNESKIKNKNNKPTNQIDISWIENFIYPQQNKLKDQLLKKKSLVIEEKEQKEEEFKNKNQINLIISILKNKQNKIQTKIEKEMKIKNVLSESYMEYLADFKFQIQMLEKIKTLNENNDLIKYFDTISKYNQYSENIQRQKTIHKTIKNLQIFINNFERGQLNPGFQNDFDKFYDKYSPVYKQKKESLKIQKNKFSEIEIQNNKNLELNKIVQNLLQQQRLRNSWDSKKQKMLQKQRQVQKYMYYKYQNDKSALKNLKKNDGKQLNIWKRAFLKIRSIKLFSMQEKFRNQVKELEEKKVQQLLLSLNYKENVDFGQKQPISISKIDPQQIYKDYQQNKIELLKLNEKIRIINKLQREEEEEFEQNINDRINQAIVNKKEQEGFKKIENNDWELIKEINNDSTFVETNLNHKEKSHWDAIQSNKPNHASNIQWENHNKKELKSVQINNSYQKFLREYEAQKVYEYVQTVHQGKFAINFFEIDQYLIRFHYFSKYSIEVRQKLMEFGILKIYEQGEIIFSQGEPSHSIYFILRGTVAVQVTKSDMGNIPVIIKILYDGQDFGEQVNLKESENLSQAVIDQLNQQKCTTIANETSYIFSFDKNIMFSILERGLQTEFEQVILFLMKVKMFKDQELHIILPLANILVKKTYQLGQYILKEGEVPQGLYIVVKGQCKVGSEKLNIGTTKKLEFEKYQQQQKPFTLKGNFQEKCIREEQKNRERIPTKELSFRESMSNEQYNKLMENNKRMLFYERIYQDENGEKIVDHIVYRDMMIFFQLLEGDIFGGRVMVTKSTFNQKEQIDRDSDDSDSNYQKSIQNVHELDEPSQLSVVADSSEVIIFLIEKQNMHLFPENVQKLLNEKLSQEFSVENPFSNEIVECIKDKFRDWEKFKINKFMQQLREQFNQRVAHKLKQI